MDISFFSLRLYREFYEISTINLWILLEPLRNYHYRCPQEHVSSQCKTIPVPDNAVSWDVAALPCTLTEHMRQWFAVIRTAV